MKGIVQRLIQAGTAIEHLEHTGWLDELTPEELEELYASYREKFRGALQTVRAEFGDPSYSLPANTDWFSQWYPEAFAAAAWKIKGGWLCLAAEHHDRETPISLLVRSLSPQELDELAE
ncbi:MAG: hypothetical protein NT013_28960 [Planctomycetia bacterium]|nr:hypothetical protein [Planctomycetia bacterium]